jgi:hypothetical protein
VINAITPWPLAGNFVLGFLAFGALALASSPALKLAGGAADSAGANPTVGSSSPQSPSPSPSPSPPPSESPAPPPPPPPANSPSRVLRRHFERLSAGDFDGAFAIMSSGFRSANPSWPSQRRSAEPYLNIVELGPSHVGSETAQVHIKFFGQDRYDTSASDTVCRSFEGDARMRKEGGKWRYDPAKGQFSVKKFRPALEQCAR